MQLVKIEKYKAVFLAGDDPTNLKTWSGTPPYMLSALRRDYDLVHIEKHPFPKYPILLLLISALCQYLAKGITALNVSHAEATC